MKAKIITVVIVIALVILVIIAAVNTKNKKESKFNIVTSFYPVYIATLNVTKDVQDVEVKNLTQNVTGCIHDYALTTKELVSLSDADVLVINGMGMEGFMSKVLSNYKNLNVIDSSKDIEGIKQEEEHEHEGHEESDEHDHEFNSHIFASVTNYIKQVKNITDGLVKLDEKNKDKYIKNSNEYIKKLEDLRENIKSKLGKLENKNIITYHNSFDYFAREFGLNVVDVIENEHGESPSSSKLASLIEEIKKEKIKAIFIEPDSNTKIVDSISKETGVKVYTLNPVTSGSENPDEYINIMRQNLNVLKEALVK